jgi:PAS domain S-box-containing protein
MDAIWKVVERRNALESLATSEDRFYRAVVNSPFPILLHAEDGAIIQASQSWCEITGYTSEELRTIADWTERAYGERKELVRADIDALYALDHRKYEGDYPIRIKDGTTRIWEFSSSPLGRLPDGRRLVISMALDVTERRRAEKESERIAREWQSTFDATNDAIWILDRDQRVLRSNKTAERFFHRPCCDMLGQPCWTVVHGTTEPHPDCPFIRARQSLQRETMELQVDECWLQVNVDPILDSAGQYAGAVHIVRDISQSKRAEESLRISEFKYRRLHESMTDAFVVTDMTGCIQEFNATFQTMLGYTDAELRQLSYLDLTPLQWHDFEARIITEQILPKGHSEVYEKEYRKRDGSIFPVELRTYLIRDNSEQPIGMWAIVRDITERKRTEGELRRLAALLNAANDAIYVRTLDHTVTYWNEAAERLYGWTRAEALGRKIVDLASVDPATFAAAQADLLIQGNWSGELTKTSKTGKEFVVFCRWTLLRDQQGRPSEILAINTDITAHKQMEAQFLRAQRMESIGSLAGGIAHDLNNILSPILMTMPFLRETVSDPDSHQMIDAVEDSARRGADIIKQLLTFARGKPGTRAPIPIHHLLKEMDKLIRETFPRNIQPCIESPPDLWPVLGDATQIYQVLMNLCVNARDAMPNGGTLTLKAENLPLDAQSAAQIQDTKACNYVCVSVSDSGTGIPPEHLERIFDPFFTTKEIGKGTGLGLATVLGIVRGHGGAMRVSSRMGQGTTFMFYLPAASEVKTSGTISHETLPPHGQGELILAVDDEVAILLMLQRILEHHGYQVLAAGDGHEALALFTQHRTQVRAVVTDMMMPGMDGLQLVEALRRLDAQLPILGITGLADRTDLRALGDLRLPVLLSKPFTQTELLTALSHALATSHQTEPHPM